MYTPNCHIDGACFLRVLDDGIRTNRVGHQGHRTVPVRAKVKNGFVVSHDFEGKRSIQIRELPDNFREIVLSKKDLKVHAIAYLDYE